MKNNKINKEKKKRNPEDTYLPLYFLKVYSVVAIVILIMYLFYR